MHPTVRPACRDCRCKTCSAVIGLFTRFANRDRTLLFESFEELRASGVWPRTPQMVRSSIAFSYCRNQSWEASGKMFRNGPFRSGMSSIIFAIISSGFEPPFRLGQESIRYLLYHGARRECYFVIEPPKRRFDHGLVEAGQEWPWIDRLDLNAERPQFVLHRFCDRLHGVLCGRIRTDHRRARPRRGSRTGKRLCLAFSTEPNALPHAELDPVAQRHSPQNFAEPNPWESR